MEVLGLPVEEARRRLAARVAEVRETMTAPPRPVEGAQVLRVVRQDVTAEGAVVLVIAAFRDLPADRPATCASPE